MSSHSSAHQFDSFIIKILDHVGSPANRRKIRNQSIVVNCFLPGHQDDTPSLHFYRESGYYKCFGCNKKGWLRDLFSDLKLGKISDDVVYESNIDPFVSLVSGLDDISDDEEPKVPGNLQEFDYDWRGISNKLLKKAGVKVYFDPVNEVNRVWFPVLMRGESVGWFARVKSPDEYQPLEDRIRSVKRMIRDTKKLPDSERKSYELDTLREERSRLERALKSIPKYRNNADQATDLILYPLDLVTSLFPNGKTIVLVEGQVDALYLIQKKIPALAILGTSNWSEYKKTVLISCGFKRVILAMDGDDAGYKAQKAIYSDIEDDFREVVRFKIPDGLDPATLPKSDIAKLKGMI